MDAVVTVREPVREIKCRVRLGMQGWGSVELYVERLTIFPGALGSWRTLAEVLANPLTRSVTFSGPWEPDRRVNIGGYERRIEHIGPGIDLHRNEHG